MLITRCRSWISSARTSTVLRTFSTLINRRKTVLQPYLLANEKRLYRRLSELKVTGGTATQALDQYVREGNFVEWCELWDCMKELRRYGNYKHALEVMEWMDKPYFIFSEVYLAVRLDLIAKVHGVSEAEDFFYNLSPELHNRHTYGALLNIYCKLKMADKALPLFEEIMSKNFTTSISFNSIMMLYMGLDKPEKVPPLIEVMRERRFGITIVSYNLWMQSFSLLGDIAGVERVFEEIIHHGKEKINWTIYSNLAGAYVKACLVEKAESALKMLEDEVRRSCLSREPYHFMISFYATLNNREQVNRVSSLLKSSFKTTCNLSYLIIIQALAKVNDLEAVKKWFEEWESNCTSYDTRVSDAVINCYLKHKMVEEAELVFHESLNRTSGPFGPTMVLFMKHYLGTQQIDLAMNCLEMAVTQADIRNWYPHSTSIDVFFEYFETQKDVEGAEKLFKILRKLNCVDDKVYSHLLQTYIAAGKTEPYMGQRIERDRIVVTPELRNMLKKVC